MTPKFVNRNHYPLVLPNGRGGVTPIEPGDTVEGDYYVKFANKTKRGGLWVYRQLSPIEEPIPVPVPDPVIEPDPIVEDVQPPQDAKITFSELMSYSKRELIGMAAELDLEISPKDNKKAIALAVLGPSTS